LKILRWYDVFKLTSALPPLRSKKEVLDTADPQLVPTLGVDRNVLANDVATRVPSTRWLKRDEAKMKYCSQSTPLPML
jgi:hypothetical protein